MFDQFRIPTSFSLIKKGKLYLLIHEKYKDLLLSQGIEEIETFVRRNRSAVRCLQGRKPHPSVPIGKGDAVVIRQCSHGGLLRFITRSLFWTGSRSFEELSLTEEVRSAGISTKAGLRGRT
ncbi:MAG: hypothetical protein QME90_04675 [Thermodesulfobacteriota bacterium]|nr:hypothetical protein [Thermodesulfobacteriota bacterium]